MKLLIVTLLLFSFANSDPINDSNVVKTLLERVQKLEEDTSQRLQKLEEDTSQRLQKLEEEKNSLAEKVQTLEDTSQRLQSAVDNSANAYGKVYEHFNVCHVTKTFLLQP